MKHLAFNLCHKFAQPACNVFINYRRIDTKRTVVRLLHDHLIRNDGVRPFLDTITMKPGDRLFDHIDKAIAGCKVGVVVLSPHYCDSFFCLYELSHLVESKKRIVPIFYDVKPSQLQVKESGIYRATDLHRFSLALEEAKHTLGISFDSSKGWVSPTLVL